MAVLRGEEARQAIARANRRTQLAAASARRTQSSLDASGSDPDDQPAESSLMKRFRRTADRLLVS